METKKVTVIKATQAAEIKSKKIKKRVCAYCRVSTDYEEQQDSFNEQYRHYEALIKSNDDWEFAGIYYDEGITGTKDYVRDGFMKMIEQCRKKKIDMIITKSIQRFARNKLDSMKYVNELRQLGIAVYFDKEHINSLDEKDDIAFSLFASIAEEESRDTSSNIRWSFKRKFENGDSTMGIEKLYGYTKDENGKVLIIEEEAEIVRLIYDLYLNGYSTCQITKKLQENNVPTCKKKGKWYESTVKSILTNEKYCGDALLQKTYCKDFIYDKRKKNKGQVPSYYVENSHKGIVSKEMFAEVQSERARRTCLYHAGRGSQKSRTGKYSNYILSNLLICDECGQPFRRCTYTNYEEKKIVYRCYSRTKYGKRYCKKSPTLNEKILKPLVLEAVNEVISISPDDISVIQSNLGKVMLEENPKNKKVDKLIDDLKSKINKELNEEFPNTEKINQLTKRINELSQKKLMIKDNLNEEFEKLKPVVEKTCNHISDFDDNIIKKIVTKIVVKEDGTLDIYFKTGLVVSKSYPI